MCLQHYSLAQDHPQGLIYAARYEQDGETVFDLYTETGKKIFDKPVGFAWSNAWDWIYAGPSEDGLKKVYDHTGTLLLDSVEAWRAPSVNTNRIPLRRNGVWRYYDKTGKLAIDSAYEKASCFTDDKAIIRKEGIVYFIDTSGRMLNMIYKYGDPVYHFQDEDIDVGMTEFTSEHYKLFEKKAYWGLSDLQDQELIPAMYDDILGMKAYFKQVTVEKNGQYGVVSLSNQVIIPIKYDEVYVLNDYLPQ